MNDFFPNLNALQQSADKDEIIDQLQAENGELLKVSQELCKSKNQNEILLQCQKEYSIEKKSLLEKIEYLETANKNNDDKINELTKKNQKLKNEKSQIQKELAEFKNQFELYKKSSKQSFKEQIQAQATELSIQCENKDKQLDEISSELNELKAKDQSNSSIIEQKSKEIEQLQFTLSTIKEKLEKCKQKNSNLQNKLDDLQKQNNSLLSTIDKMKHEIKNKEKEIKILKEQQNKDSSILETQSNQIEELVKKVSEYQSINPKAKTPEELKNDFMNRKNTCKVIKMKYQKCQKKLSIAIDKLNEQTRAMEGAASDLSDVQDNALSLQKQINDYENEIIKLKKRIDKFIFRETIGKSILKANTYLTNKLSLIETKINPEIAKPSFRSIFIMIIALKRWSSIIGLQKLYERDIRIWWWWLVPTESSKNITASNNNIDSILEYIDQRNKTNEDQKVEIENLKINLSHFTEENQKIAKDLDEQIENNKNQENQIEELNTKLDELTEQMKSMIDQNDFEEILTKYKSTKAALKATKEFIKSQDQEINSLNEQIQNLEQRRKMQHNYLKLSEKSNKNVQKQLSNAHEKIGQLEIELDYRDKENLALERHLNHAEIVESRLRANCMTMAQYNNNGLFDSEPDYQKGDCDIKKKLHIMSQNLITEYN